MNAIRVAVIIPARNAAPYIAETLESVLAQEVKPNEIIVVNDKSTDSTAEIASRYNAHGVRVLDGPGRGAPAALNFGIERTDCELIAHFDADDIMLPSKLRIQVGPFRDNSSLGLVSSDLRMFCGATDDPRTFLQSRRHIEQLRNTNGRDGFVFLNSNEAKSCLCHEHCIDVKGVYRRDAWRIAGGFDPTFRCAYDMDFVWRVASKFDVAISNDVLFKGRRHEGNLSASDELVASDCSLLFRKMLAAELSPGDRAVLQRRLKGELLDLAHFYRRKHRWPKAIQCYVRAFAAA